MTKIGFFSDLDQTLVYSLNQLHKRGQLSTGHLVAEEYNNIPLSFLDIATWQLLLQHAGTSFEFIPVTTRTFEQFSRIQFPQVQISNAVVLNGAQIFTDGKEDLDWTRKVQQGVQQHSHSPAAILEKLTKKLAAHDEVKTVRNADNMFSYVVANTPESPYVDELTKEVASETGYTRSKQGRKTYLVPSNLSKGAAVAELTKRLGLDLTFAAGDSVLDFTMIDKVNHFIHPSHGDTPPTSRNVYSTPSQGIKASYEVLDFVLRNLRYFGLGNLS